VSIAFDSSTALYDDSRFDSISRTVNYRDDYVQDYIWDSGNIKLDKPVYGFARIEAYETYLAYADNSANNTDRKERRPSFLRRCLSELRRFVFH